MIGTKGDPDDGRLEDPRELRAGLRRDGDREREAAGAADPRQDEHRRVRDGLVDRELRLRPVAQPVGPDPRAGRLGRRQRSRRVGRARAVGARLRHRRLDQAAGSALRPRRATPDVRHRLAVRRGRVRIVARPGRPGREERTRLRVPLLDHRGPRRERLDDRRRPGSRAAERRRPEGRADRRAEGDERRRRDRAGCHRGRRARDRACRVARRERGGVLAAALGRLRRRLLLPRRACRGVVEPRALRRRALRAARRRRRLPRDGDAHARRRIRRRAEAPHHDRHLRALVRLLRRVLRHRAEGAHRDQARARRAVRAIRRDRVADEPDGCVPARCEDRRPARDVHERPAHDSVVHGGPAGPERSLRAVGGAAGRAAADRRRSSPRTRSSGSGHALEQAIGFDVVPARSAR